MPGVHTWFRQPALTQSRVEHYTQSHRETEWPPWLAAGYFHEAMDCEEKLAHTSERTHSPLQLAVEFPEGMHHGEYYDFVLRAVLKGDCDALKHILQESEDRTVPVVALVQALLLPDSLASISCLEAILQHPGGQHCVNQTFTLQDALALEAKSPDYREYLAMWPPVLLHLLSHISTWVDDDELRTYQLFPIHLAAAIGRIEACQLLCNAGADSFKLDCRGSSCLALAAASGHADTVLLFMKLQDRAFANKADITGSTALHHAASLGRHEALDVLLSKADTWNVLSTNEVGMWPLALAADSNHEKCVLALAKRSTTQELNMGHNISNRTALQFAALAGGTASVAILLRYGADAMAIDVDGNTALHLARNPDTVNLLAEHAALVQQRNRAGMTPLAVAASHYNPRVVDALLHKGADPNTRDMLGRTPLHHAAAQSRCPCTGTSAVLDSEEQECCRKVACMKLLLAARANINIADSNGSTPLHVALSNYRLDSARFLLRHGAQPDLRDQLGNTPLAVANQVHILECVLAYIQARVDPDKVRADIERISRRLVSRGETQFINTLQLMREAGWLGDLEVNALVHSGSLNSEWSRLRHVVPTTMDLWSLSRAHAGKCWEWQQVPGLVRFMRFEDYALLISGRHFTYCGLLEGKTRPRRVDHDRIQACFSRPRPAHAR